MSEHETIADIIAEMFDRADKLEHNKLGQVFADSFAKLHREYALRFNAARKRMEWTHKKELETRDAVIQTEVAAREAEREAHKHEMEAIGDTAKLREALCEILSYIESFHKYITPGKGKKLTALFAVADTIRGKARAALAEPPRNCDVYNNESCRMAYHLHGDGLMTMQAFADWLFAHTTEKEGGANG